jgi:hypothetical protein
MGLFKPARQQVVDENVEIVSNLDDIISKKIAFVLHGKTHLIHEITTKVFLQLSNALAGLWAMHEKKETEAGEVITAFYDTIHSVCDSITKEDIEQCTQIQLAGIFNLIMTHVMGNAQANEGKKKVIKESAFDQRYPN